MLYIWYIFVLLRFSLPPPSAPATPTKSFDDNFRLEPNLSVKDFHTNSNNSSTNQQQQSQQQSQQQQLSSAILDKNIADDKVLVGRRKYKKRVQFSDTVNGVGKLKHFSNFSLKIKKHQQQTLAAINATTPTATSSGDDQVLPEVLDCRIAEKIKSEMEEKGVSKLSSHTQRTPSNALCLKKNGIGGNRTFSADHDIPDGKEHDGNSNSLEDSPNNNMHLKEMRDNNMENSLEQQQLARSKCKRSSKLSLTAFPLNNSTCNVIEEDIGGDDDSEADGTEDDEEDETFDEEALLRELKSEQNFVEEEDELDIAFRSQQSCRDCSLTHDYKLCPLRTALGTITDAVDLTEWIERRNLEAIAKLKADAQHQAKQLHGDDDEDMDETSHLSELETKPLITFAEASVPAEFELHNVEPNVTGVFARTEIRSFTKLGPLIGQSMLAAEIREGSDMKWIFEICAAGAEKSSLVLCDNPNSSNWLRYIRPAPTYEERNVNLVAIESQAYFVTCRELKNGMELLYWSDNCNTMWRKKHWAEKNSKSYSLHFFTPLPSF